MDSGLDLDHFIERDGVRFAGMHLIVDLWGAHDIDSLEIVEQALIEAADRAGATVLHTHLHHFVPNGGVSGVLVLAESHISIHTWPEAGYAALDMFMCGDSDPHAGLPVLREAFRPQRMDVTEHRRGVLA